MSSQGKRDRRVYVWMAGLILIWGSFAAVNRLALNTLDVFQVQFYIFGFAVAALLVWMAVGRRFPILRQISLREWGWLLLLGVLSFLYYFLYSISLNAINPVDASCVNYLFPVLITLLAVPINGEKMTGQKAISVLCGFLGMLLIVTGGDFSRLQFDNAPGLLCALAASLCWALFSTIGKRVQIDIVASSFVYAGIGFVLSAILLAACSEWAWPSPLPLASMAWNGVMNFCVSYYLWFRTLKSGGASFGASLSFITPFVTIAFLALFPDESIHWSSFVGLGIIVGGLLVPQYLFRRRHGIS